MQTSAAPSAPARPVALPPPGAGTAAASESRYASSVGRPSASVMRSPFCHGPAGRRFILCAVRPAAGAGLVAVLALALYLVTGAPGITWRNGGIDSGELA